MNVLRRISSTADAIYVVIVDCEPCSGLLSLLNKTAPQCRIFPLKLWRFSRVIPMQIAERTWGLWPLLAPRKAKYMHSKI